ncbi:MAG: hypothetical protein QG573_148, partial [Acidobacteriota bacterium]|nr:hypothetical protein [Acidobacteriota bacterium]
MRKTVQACVVVAACGFPAAVLGVSQPRLIADLATVPSPQEGSVPAEFVQVGAYLLFTARPDDHARRLWRSDGTAAGTQELANACGPLEEGGFALRFATPARAFYSVSCGGGAKALWVSDGTPSGTQVLLGVGSYDDTGALIAAAQWVEDDDDVLFLQRGGYNLPLELWRSDGSVGGTARIAVVSESDRVTGALHRRGAGDLLLLVEEPSRKLVVWRSDGTPAGTQPARVLEFPDQYLSLRSVHPTATGIAFMVSLAPPSRNELWYSDGTVAGTGLGAVLPDLLSEVPVTHEGSLYFTAEVNGEEWLWRGDGSAATTRPIVPLGSRGARSDSFEFFDGRLYFVACEADRRSCALLSTAVDGGLPAHVAAVCDDDDCVEIDDDLWVRGRGSRLIFTHRDETSVEVWTSAPDGSGAAVVATLCAAESCFGPHVGPMVLESAVFFATVADAGGARELWSSDGTVAGTLRLAGPLPDIQWYVYPDVWAPLAALPGGGGWVFAAADTEHGLELWRARPQADSGAMVEDLRPDRPGLFNPEPVGTVGSTFVFALLS